MVTPELPKTAISTTNEQPLNVNRHSECTVSYNSSKAILAYHSFSKIKKREKNRELLIIILLLIKIMTADDREKSWGIMLENK